MRESLGALLADIVLGKESPDSSIGWTTEKGWVSVREKGFEAQRSFLSRLAKTDGIKGRFSLDYLEKKLRESVNQKFVIPSAPIGRATESILDEMLSLANARLRRRLVNVPVFGVKVVPDHMTVEVGNVEFYTLGNAEKSRWLSLVEKDTLLLIGDGPLRGSDVWAKVEVVAAKDDHAHLKEVCVESVTRAMTSLLLFLFAYPFGDYLVLLYPYLPPHPAIWRDPSLVRRRYVVEITDQQKYDAGAAVESRAPPRALRITEEVLREYYKNGFGPLSDLIKNPRTDLQKRIYDSLQLFSTAYNSEDPAVSYLNYVAMLEMLVMKPRERAITYSMSLRISWILGDDFGPEDREKIRKIVTGLYQDRSKIAHGQIGEVEDVHEQLLTLRQFAYRLVKKLAGCKNFTCQEDVVRWVKGKVLGLQDPFDTPLAQPWIS
jgi:hypothetical protein